MFAKKNRKRRSSVLLASDTKNFQLQESYKELRTNVSFLIPDKKNKVIALTSTHPGEGKSTTAVNLAVSLAEMGNSVIMIDADMRRPTLQGMVGNDFSCGLSDVLIGKNDYKQAIKQSEYTGMDVMTAGIIPPNPAELLAGNRLKGLVEELRREYDYVIVDTPPIGIVADCLSFTNIVDGYLFVVRNKLVTYAELDEVVEKLQLVNANILGFILNGVEGSGKAYYKKKRNTYRYKSIY